MSPLSQVVRNIIYGMTGAIRLVKLDSKGFDYFGNTRDDFWRSFLGAALLAPIFILYLVIRYFNSPSENSFSIYLISQMLAYSIAWLTFPLVMLYLAPVLQCSNKVLRYLVAYNWLSVILNGIYLPVIILGIVGTFSEPFTNLLAITVLMWVLGMGIFVAHNALQVSFATSAGIVVIDLLLGLLIEVLTSQAR